jgi:hydroxypyruvate reductase
VLGGSELRAAAWRMMRAALQAVEPGAAVRRHVQLAGDALTVAGDNPEEARRYDLGQYDRLWVVGGGKAGAPMAAALAERLGRRQSGGLVVVKYGHALGDAAAAAPVEIVEAGHPIPDRAGQRAAGRMADLLRGAGERDLVLCVISGGGSALMTLPVTGVSLADLQALTQILLRCGATINQINTLRKHLSQLAGGRLAKLACPATIVSLILSDVVGDPLDVIASGPTVADPTTFADAWQIVADFGVAGQLPAAITHHLQAGLSGALPDTLKPGDPSFERVQNVVIGSNCSAGRAAAAMAQQLGFDTLLLTSFLEGEASQVGRVLAGLAKGLARAEAMHPPGRPLARPACLVLGGETTVTLRGDGKGGRNQEMALSAALALAGWPDLLVAGLATDGTDGPTDAAGAFADGSTVPRAAASGMRAADYLARNDAYHFFGRLDDLIVTGPTQTNVNDLALVLAG